MHERAFIERLDLLGPKIEQFVALLFEIKEEIARLNRRLDAIEADAKKARRGAGLGREAGTRPN